MQRNDLSFRSFAAAILIVCLMFTAPAFGADVQWPKALKIATPALGSNSYNIVLAWANKIEADTGMKVRLLPEESTSAKWSNLKSGRFDLVQETLGYVANWMCEGRSGFATQKAGPFPVRLVWQNQVMRFCLFVRGDSPVQTIYDIPKQGKDFRMVHWTVPGGLEIIQATLAWVNMTTDDITLVKTGSYTGSVRMVAEGKVDFAPFGITPASTFIEASANPHGLRILELDPEKNPEGANRYRQYMPAYSFPKTVAGPKEFQGKTGWGTQGGMICRAEMDAEVVYNLIKWSMDNFDQLQKLHPSIKRSMSLESNMATFNHGYLPLHDGVIRYLKEKALWTEANARRQQYNLKLQQKYIDAFKEAISMANAKGIKIYPDNQEWVTLWDGLKEKKELPRLKVLTDAEVVKGLQAMK